MQKYHQLVLSALLVFVTPWANGQSNEDFKPIVVTIENPQSYQGTSISHPDLKRSDVRIDVYEKPECTLALRVRSGTNVFVGPGGVSISSLQSVQLVKAGQPITQNVSSQMHFGDYLDVEYCWDVPETTLQDSELKLTVLVPTGALGAFLGWEGLSPSLAWGIWAVCAIASVVFLKRWSRGYSPAGSTVTSEFPDNPQWLNRILPIVRIYQGSGWDFWRVEGIVLFNRELIRFRKRRHRAIDVAYLPGGADELKLTKGIKIKDIFPLELIDDVLIEQPSLLNRKGITIKSGDRSVRLVIGEHEVPNLVRALQILLPGRVCIDCRIPFKLNATALLFVLTLSLWLPLSLTAHFLSIPLFLLFLYVTAGIFLSCLPKRILLPFLPKKFKKETQDLSHHRPLRSRPLSLLAKLLAIIIIVTYFLIHRTDVYTFLTFDTAQTGIVAAAVYFVVSNLLQVANGLWQKDPNRMGKTSNCRSIVYLRSFLDDRETNLHPNTWFSSILGLTPPYGGGVEAFEGYPFYRMYRTLIRYFYNYHPVRLFKLLLGCPLDTSEQQLASFLSRYGLFVAIGKPGERFATVGASRMYVGNDEWQGIVKGLLEQPQFVLLQPSSTEGIWWEVEQTLKTVKPNRVLMCLVNYVGRQNDYETFRLRLEQLLPEGTEAPRSVGYNRAITFFCFDSHWEPRQLYLKYYSKFLWPLRFQAINFMRSLEPFLLVCGLIDSDGETRPIVKHQPEPTSEDPQHQESSSICQ